MRSLLGVDRRPRHCILAHGFSGGAPKARR